jgi:hypothetical protein
MFGGDGWAALQPRWQREALDSAPTDKEQLGLQHRNWEGDWEDDQNGVADSPDWN